VLEGKLKNWFVIKYILHNIKHNIKHIII
jgi:hypothetical protein